jgi:DNA modification methylase
MRPWAKIIIGDSRKMPEIQDGEVGLIVTSPPYWHLKDYGVEAQIGFGQTLHEYLKDLFRVWQESYRVLEPGRRLVINIGDQFARSIIYGRYKVIPLHAEVISQCERIGFDYMGSIIWQKKTTMNTTGGANVMGSYPYPPNGIVEIDYEFIMIFRKPGKSRKVPSERKKASELSKEEWKEYFKGHWYFGGVRQKGHEAMFPEELPKRVIKMFSFQGDTVLDPFLGSSTTAKVALSLRRNAVGYEINEKYVPVIRNKIGLAGSVEIHKREGRIAVREVDYVSSIADAELKISPEKFDFKKGLYKVIEVLDGRTVKLNTGLVVELLGVQPANEAQADRYLREYILGKEVRLRFDKGSKTEKDRVGAYVYLKNGIFVNFYMVKSGIAVADRSTIYEMKEKFLAAELKTVRREA